MEHCNTVQSALLMFDNLCTVIEQNIWWHRTVLEVEMHRRLHFYVYALLVCSMRCAGATITGVQLAQSRMATTPAAVEPGTNSWASIVLARPA